MLNVVATLYRTAGAEFSGFKKKKKQIQQRDCSKSRGELAKTYRTKSISFVVFWPFFFRGGLAVGFVSQTSCDTSKK